MAERDFRRFTLRIVSLILDPLELLECMEVWEEPDERDPEDAPEEVDDDDDPEDGGLRSPGLEGKHASSARVR